VSEFSSVFFWPVVIAQHLDSLAAAASALAQLRPRGRAQIHRLPGLAASFGAHPAVAAWSRASSADADQSHPIVRARRML
jgi:hypothetical protein